MGLVLVVLQIKLHLLQNLRRCMSIHLKSKSEVATDLMNLILNEINRRYFLVVFIVFVPSGLTLKSSIAM